MEVESVFQVVHTWLGQGDQICHILHEDAPLELQFWLAAFVHQLLVAELVLGLAKVDVFAAEEDGFEEVDVILSCASVVSCAVTSS